MKRRFATGPSIVLALTVLAVLLGGPWAMREFAYAQEQAHIDQIRNQIKTSHLAELSNAFKDVAQIVEPSVVHIAVSSKIEHVHNQMPDGIPKEFRKFFPNLPQNPDEGNNNNDDGGKYDQYDVPETYASGSGWVYSHDGKNYIITNNHVVKDADEITIKFYDKTETKATVVGTDPQTDIAVLSVKSGPLHPAELAPKTVEQGEIVFAFGSPFQFDFSMSQGIVSGSGRRLGILGQTGYENFIQTDAAINPGNSGGPLTNIYGQVVGMNSAIATRTGAFNGIGFAIPTKMISEVANQIIDKGKVSRGYLGVWIRKLDPKLAKSFGFNGEGGALVEDLVDKNSPAAKGGMQPGDIVTEINGNKVTSADELRRVVANYAPGQTIKVQVFRDGKTKMLSIKLTEQPKNVGVASAEGLGNNGGNNNGGALKGDVADTLRKLGIDKLEPFTKQMAERLQEDYTPGVIIEEVRPGSVAATEGLAPGAVILGVQGQPVHNLDQLSKELAKHDVTQGVRLRVQVQGVKTFVVLALPK